MRPPGATTRASSANTSGSDTKLRNAKPHVTAVAHASGRGNAVASACTEFAAERAAMRAGEHRAREVDAEHLRAARRGELREIAGAAGEIENAIVRTHRDRVEREPPPTAIEPEAEDAIQRVVARRDALEHRSHGALLVLGARQRIAGAGALTVVAERASSP